MTGQPLLPLGAYEGMGAEGHSSRLGVRPGTKDPAPSGKVGGSRARKARAQLSSGHREVISVQRLREKARTFQKESKTLGRHVKSSVRAPRQLLDMGASLPTSDGQGEDAPSVDKKTSESKGAQESKTAADEVAQIKRSSSVTKPISAPHWQVRQAINKSRRLVLKIMSLNAALMQSGQKDTQAPETRQSLTDELARTIGLEVKPNAPPGAPVLWSVQSDVFKQIVSSTKGRRLICRAIPVLAAAHVAGLIVGSMSILGMLVAAGDPAQIQAAATLQLQKEAWWRAVLDERIAELIVRGLATATTPGPEMCPVDLLIPCLGQLMSNHDSKTLKELVASRGGAIVVQELIRRGQQFCGTSPNGQMAAQWGDLYNRFVAAVTG